MGVVGSGGQGPNGEMSVGRSELAGKNLLLVMPVLGLALMLAAGPEVTQLVMMHSPVPVILSCQSTGRIEFLGDAARNRDYHTPPKSSNKP